MIARRYGMLLVACAAVACDPAGQQPPPTGTGPVSALAAPCLSPLRPGESDPAVRDVSIVVSERDRTATFRACIVSDRFERLALARAEVAVLSEVGRRQMTWAGSERANVSRVRQPTTGMPKVVVLVSNTASVEGFVGAVADTIAVRLVHQTCRVDVVDQCVPDQTVRTSLVPAVFHRVQR